MIHPLLAALAISLTLTAAAAAEETCRSCHGKKGMKPVDIDSFEQSVHRAFPCTSCHAGIDRYPHGRVRKADCGICHFSGREGAPQKKALEYRQSVHGRALATAAPDCRTCHGSHAVFPSSDSRSNTSPRKIPALCSRCHPEPFEAYGRSIHGTAFLERKNASAPTCFTCHREHGIPGTASEPWKLALIEECGACHAEQMETYRKTYHGRVTRLGYTAAATCSDCHGSHLILPPPVPASTLSDRNIVATCRKCHPRAARSFTKFYAHAEEGNREKYPVLYYTYLFMTALLVSVFAFFLTHTALWAYRSLKERREKKGGG